MNIFQPIIAFLAAASGDEAAKEWDKGPQSLLFRTRNSRNNPVAIGDYIAKVRLLEQRGMSAKEIAQRLRRMHYSIHPKGKSKAGPYADECIVACTPYAQPPLTTDQIDQATLDFFWSCDTVMTASGAEVDLPHVWMLVDLKLSGKTAAGGRYEVFFDTDHLEPVFSWAGDLGSAVNEYSKAVNRNPRVQRTDPVRQVAMSTVVSDNASKADLYGDLDAVVLAAWAAERGPALVLSTLLDDYYKDDALGQAQARALKRPCSARRFHYFLAHVVPELPADGMHRQFNSELHVTLRRDEAARFLQTFILDAADDLMGFSTLVYDAESNVTQAGRAPFDMLAARFADFLVAGLATGDAPWPPTNWI